MKLYKTVHRVLLFEDRLFINKTSAHGRELNDIFKYAFRFSFQSF